MTEHEQRRLVRHRLAILRHAEEVTGNGKVERSHRIDQEEFYRMLEGVVIDDPNLVDDRLQQWEGLLQLQPAPRRTRRRHAV